MPSPFFQMHLHKTARYWLFLAIAAFAIAGLFSLPPVILRGPFFADKLPVQHIFDVSLVAHVNLSVLIWMLSIYAMLTTMIQGRIQPLQHYCTVPALLGLIAMSIAPFFPNTLAIKSNYIPVLTNISFMMGLGLFGAAILVHSLVGIYELLTTPRHRLWLGGLISHITILIATICFTASLQMIEDTSFTTKDDLHVFYEALFWGGGHALQFVFVTMVIIAWLWLLDYHTSINASFINWLFGINLLAVLALPIIYITSENLDQTTAFFTEHMRYAGGIAAILAMLFIARHSKALLKNYHHNPATAASLVFSLILFASGGLISLFIDGANAIIPAHYHGSIIGMSLAFIGIIYLILPQFSYHHTNRRWSHIQPICYGMGQLMHISGLALMGGYGALRKTANATASIDTTIGKMLFFFGGAVAIIGGLLFIIIVLHALMKGKKDHA